MDNPNAQQTPLTADEPMQEAAEESTVIQEPVEQLPQQPVYQQPVYQAPQQPVYQQPVYQQPVYQQPVYQAPQQPVYQQPVYQAPQQPVYQQPYYTDPNYANPAGAYAPYSQQPVQPNMDQLRDSAFNKALASAILSMFPVASIVGIVQGAKGKSLANQIIQQAAQQGFSAGGKARAAAIMAKAGMITSIVFTAIYGYIFLMLIMLS